MIISGMSGNEIYCLSLKGFSPGEMCVGNSVQSLGLAGSIGSSFKTLAGGEIQNITQLISAGRHAAITRMEDEAKRANAIGVTGVTSELKTLAGYTEFLSQGTGVYCSQQRPFFSTAASGTEMYCHLDAGYQPMKFVMGNVAYSLGIGRGVLGGLRTMAKGEVKEYSDMYNGIRHIALQRLQEEAAALGANAVVDVSLEMVPFGAGTLELLMTGTASYHPQLAQGRLAPEQVVTSELTGEELWNVARMGYAPVRLVMTTSVYSLGIAAGIGTIFAAMSKGELSEVTQLVYSARENCLGLLRREAEAFGAERVIGNRLIVRELMPGLIEIVAVGTALRPAQGMAPATENLITQAVIVDRESVEMEFVIPGMNAMAGNPFATRRMPAMGCLMGGGMAALMVGGSLLAAFARNC